MWRRGRNCGRTFSRGKPLISKDHRCKRSAIQKRRAAWRITARPGRVIAHSAAHRPQLRSAALPAPSRRQARPSARPDSRRGILAQETEICALSAGARPDLVLHLQHMRRAQHDCAKRALHPDPTCARVQSAICLLPLLRPVQPFAELPDELALGPAEPLVIDRDGEQACSRQPSARASACGRGLAGATSLDGSDSSARSG